MTKQKFLLKNANPIIGIEIKNLKYQHEPMF